MLLLLFAPLLSCPMVTPGTAACVTAAVTFASRVIVAFDRCERLGRCMNMGINMFTDVSVLGLGCLDGLFVAQFAVRFPKLGFVTL